MPSIDPRSGDIVIRIVYDGMPEAGKTTNIQQLFPAIPLQRRGKLASPDATGRRTEFFDWLDFAGGFVDGRRVRCQLVSVPGQPQLLHRRRYLLESADVVVFVADSRAEMIEENRQCLEALLRLLESFHETFPAPIVIQANKQDLPGSLRARALFEALGVPLVTPVVPAVAHAARGVMDTFVLAVRLASDRVRALMLDGAELEPQADAEGSAEALHATMLARELPTLVPEERTVTRISADSLVRTRPNDVAAARACKLPRAESLLAGHVWPPVKGRAAVATAAAGTVEIPERALDWAPADAMEIALEPGWVIHSSTRWVFSTERDARLHLMNAVRTAAATLDLVPEGRALFVAPEEEAFRAWVLTPDVPSLAVELVDAVGARDPRAIADALERVDSAAATLVEARGSSVVPGGAAGVGARNGRVFLLALGEGGTAVDEHASQLLSLATGTDQQARAAVAEARSLVDRARSTSTSGG